MESNEYQKLAMRTAADDPGWAEAALGLVGEAGEVADIIKKHMFHGHPLDRDHIKEELGDVCWYVVLCCYIAGFTLSDVMEENIRKLQVRYADGFSTENSIRREDVTAVAAKNKLSRSDIELLFAKMPAGITLDLRGCDVSGVDLRGLSNTNTIGTKIEK